LQPFFILSTLFSQTTLFLAAFQMSPPGSSPPKTAVPYQMLLPKSAKEALAWSLYYVVEAGHDSTFPEEFGLDFGLTDVAMLDPKNIEKEGLKAPAYVGLDLETSLDGCIRDAQMWEYSRMIQSWLNQTPNRKLKAEVEKLMDSELKEFGVDIQGKNMSFWAKVSISAAMEQYRNHSFNFL
jgi:hypothetical protein